MSANPQNERVLSLAEAPATIAAYMELSRYPQTLAVALSTLIGAVWADASLSPAALIGIILSNVCLFVGATALNDACDVIEDSVNKPHRPVPSGRVTRTDANAFATAFFILGTLLAALVTPWLGVAATIVCVMSVAYATMFKRIPFLGNVIVAAISTYPLYCMLVVGGEPSSKLLHLVAAFLLFRIGAELIKTAEDRAGDAYAGIRTAATAFGETAIYRLGSIILIVAIIVMSVAPGNHWIVAAGLFVSMVLAIAAFVLSFRLATLEHGRKLIHLERAIIVVMISALTLQIVFEKIN